MVAERDAENVVRRFFRFVRSGRIDDLVQLFAHNAVVREPLSSSGVLSDRQDIESFLKVALVHNSEMLSRLEIEKAAGSRVSAAVVFENGGRTKGVFTFDLDSETKKIARLEMAFGSTDPARA